MHGQIEGWFWQQKNMKSMKKSNHSIKTSALLTKFSIIIYSIYFKLSRVRFSSQQVFHTNISKADYAQSQNWKVKSLTFHSRKNKCQYQTVLDGSDIINIIQYHANIEKQKWYLNQIPLLKATLYK